MSALAGLDIQIEDGDLGAAAGECARHLAAQDAGAAGDGDDKAGEVVHLDVSSARSKESIVVNFRCVLDCERCCHRASPSQFRKSLRVEGWSVTAITGWA